MGLSGLDDDQESSFQINLIMLTYRGPPPVEPSRSLDGLERVIPPGTKFPTSRTDIQLNKPLPASPAVVEKPAMSVWSDNSSMASSDDRTASDHSSETYPIFVDSDSDGPIDLGNLGDLGDLSKIEDHHRPVTKIPPPDKPTSPKPHSRNHGTLDPDSSSQLAVKAVVSQERYSSDPRWTQSRMATNHYFREKKWDFFPELAPSALQSPTSLLYSGRNTRRRRRDGGRLNLPMWSPSRWHLDHAATSQGLGIASGVRDSIRSYVHRTLSKDEEPNQRRRPVTVPSIYPYKTSTSLSDRSLAHSGGRQDSLDIFNRFGSLSMSDNGSYIHERHSDDLSIRCAKYLATPTSPYQAYDTSTLHRSSRTKRISSNQHKHNPHVRFPKYQVADRSPRMGNIYSTSAPVLSSSVLSLSHRQQLKDRAKESHGATHHVRSALDDAKRMVTGSAKAERRRERLKAQIRLVRPVSPYSNGDGVR